jgi:hypothetical protein
VGPALPVALAVSSYSIRRVCNAERSVVRMRLVDKATAVTPTRWRSRALNAQPANPEPPSTATRGLPSVLLCARRVSQPRSRAVNDHVRSISATERRVVNTNFPTGVLTIVAKTLLASSSEVVEKTH